MTVDRRVLTDIVNDLVGQCVKDLDDVAREHGVEPDAMTLVDHDFIDSMCFECTDCGWWCDIEELADRVEGGCVCEDCAEGADD